MRRGILVLAVTAVSAASFGQISLNAISDFQSGPQGWLGPNASVNTTGGPGGAGDAYLQVFSDGSGQGGALATYNTGWNGNYQAAGVGRINAQIRNFGAQQVLMRVVLFDTVTGARWTSTTPHAVAANSAWTNASFSLAEADLTRVLGSSSYSSVMSNVFRLMIRHDDSPPSSGGTPVANGHIGIDNVQAVPEPASLAALALGGAALLRRRRR